MKVSPDGRSTDRVRPLSHSWDEEEVRVAIALLAASRLTRRQIAERLGLSKTKTNAVVANLLASGVVAPDAAGDTNRGRKPNVLRLHQDLGYGVGVDLGPTDVRIVLGDSLGRSVAEDFQIIDMRRGPVYVLATIASTIKAMLDRAVPKLPLVGVAMGVPGPVDFVAGMPISSPITPGWDRFPVRDHLAELLGCDVVVDNDVNVMLVGEAWRRPELSNSIFVKVGTGIGAAIMCNGILFRGVNGYAGDIGHILVDEHGPACRCGSSGCLEALAGGAALAREAETLAQQDPACCLAARAKTGGPLTAEDVGWCAHSGDITAVALVQQAGRHLGRVLAALVNFYNPSHIILGGGVSKLGHLYLAAVRREVFAHSLSLHSRELAIESSQLGDSAGVQGGVVLAWTLHLGGK